ncbi:hypothetical protein QTJ16_000699 [Diplocarpon rosae]|uniref:Cupin type-2 domain-containing protein n=1 Tax=Diplocarpon rosae TaxID=946125 RepID=A0AAD9T6X3_9HELO|nr:hypothetical protein QTJ16_000699 [Diplocarpon rosae]
MERLTSPPSSSRPYSLPAFAGELWTIPTSNSVMRLLVTAKETDNAFAVVSTGGTNDKPIGFHFHKEAHDVFLCLKGTMNVWADDQARTLREGDFASVPPNTIHQYQITSPHTEFAGLIIPGGWEEFFRFIGEPYSGPLFPTNDKRNPLYVTPPLIHVSTHEEIKANQRGKREVLVPKLIAATETFDMIPVREKAHFEPQPWDPATDSKLPGTYARGGYFLQADTGSRFVVGGTVVRPLATRRETDSKFSIYELLASSLHAPLAAPLSFARTHHAIFVVSGSLDIELTLPASLSASASSASSSPPRTNPSPSTSAATAGETVFVPAGTPFRFAAATRYARAYVFANGGGLGEVLCRVGREYEAPGVPEESVAWDEAGVKELEGELGFVTGTAAAA